MERFTIEVFTNASAQDDVLDAARELAESLDMLGIFVGVRVTQDTAQEIGRWGR